MIGNLVGELFLKKWRTYLQGGQKLVYLKEELDNIHMKKTSHKWPAEFFEPKQKISLLMQFLFFFNFGKGIFYSLA